MPDVDPRAIEIQQLPGHFFGMWLCYMIDVKADKNCDFSSEMQLDRFPHFFQSHAVILSFHRNFNVIDNERILNQFSHRLEPKKN